MKKFYLMTLVAISIVISGCDNQAKQREIEKQRQEDSIRVAENVKKELAEKEAKERAEREKKEAEERAEREKKEAEERAEREKQEAQELAEREARTWTGANSVSELRQKLDGTSWYINQKGLKRKIVFSHGSVTMYTSMNDDFNEDGHKYDSFEAKSQDGVIVVFFGGSEEHIGDRSFSIGFTDRKAILFQFDKPIGELTFMGR